MGGKKERKKTTFFPKGTGDWTAMSSVKGVGLYSTGGRRGAAGGEIIVFWRSPRSAAATVYAAMLPAHATGRERRAVSEGRRGVPAEIDPRATFIIVVPPSAR